MAARLSGLVRSCRPRQWLKNVLVFAAPAAAGALTQPAALGRVALAFVAFCLASSGTYLINDAHDAPADRLHPRKRDRPVARGVIPVPVAHAAGGALLLAAIGCALLGPDWQLPTVVVAYVGLTVAYSRWLKHLPLLDLVIVATGFVLRTIGGAAALPVTVSSWFLIVVSFGSLGVVAGKREAELRAANHVDTAPDDVPPPTRTTLAHYSRDFLGHVRAVTTAGVLIAYSLWALQPVHDTLPRILFGISILPLTVAILRYGMLVDHGHGEEPEDLVLRDPALLVSGAAIALLVMVGAYATWPS